MHVPSQIFKAYDIRGLVEGELSEELFYRLGRAAVVFSGAKHVMVGYDMRPSSRPFAEALIRGLTEQGANVVDIGLITTPMLNILTMLDPMAELGAMITASHNPQEYNGCKFIYKKTRMPIGLESGLEEIRKLIEQYEFVGVAEPASVSVENKNTEYVDFVYSLIDKNQIKPMKVALDFGNGIEGVIIDDVLARVPVSSEYLYKEPDGRFPNHEANPLKHDTLKDLQKRVVQTGAAFGVAFDGDADRIGLVDETGRIVPGDIMLALLVQAMVPGNPRAKVIFDLKCSRVVKETILAAGGEPIESRVGRTLIIERMRTDQALLGGELSGHFYFRDTFGFECSDLVLLQFLKLLSLRGLPLSTLVNPLLKYAHSGEINFTVEDKEGIMKRLEERFGPGAASVSHLDGVKIEYSDWWFCIRQSNTEPLLRMVVEADTKELMDEKVEEIRRMIKAN